MASCFNADARRYFSQMYLLLPTWRRGWRRFTGSLATSGAWKLKTHPPLLDIKVGEVLVSFWRLAWHAEKMKLGWFEFGLA